MQKILVAEDSELNKELLVTILEAHGYQVVTANEGAEAFSLACANELDLVLMDIQMPGTDGYEGFALLQNHKATAALPVIAVTGNAMPHDLTKIHEAGFHGILNKPFKVDELMKAIHLLI